MIKIRVERGEEGFEVLCGGYFLISYEPLSDEPNTYGPVVYTSEGKSEDLMQILGVLGIHMANSGVTPVEVIGRATIKAAEMGQAMLVEYENPSGE